MTQLAAYADGFNGAEIEEAIIASLFDAFSTEGELDTDTIIAALQETVPLSKTMSEELARLRGWAAGRARPATKDVKPVAEAVSRRKLEL